MSEPLRRCGAATEDRQCARPQHTTGPHMAVTAYAGGGVEMSLWLSGGVPYEGKPGEGVGLASILEAQIRKDPGAVLHLADQIATFRLPVASWEFADVLKLCAEALVEAGRAITEERRALKDVQRLTQENHELKASAPRVLFEEAPDTRKGSN